jgi:hypothetical protein
LVLLTGDVDPADELWAELCELHVPMRLAGHHALDDFQLRAEDEAALDQIPSLRQRYRALASTSVASRPDADYLEYLDGMLCSLEGRAQSYRLMVSAPEHRSR